MFTIEKDTDDSGVLRNVVTGESIEDTLQNLDAYLKLFGQLQDTTTLIRRAPNVEACRAALRDALGVNDEQVDAILRLRLETIVDVTRDHVLTADERAQLDADRAERAARRGNPLRRADSEQD